MNEWQVDQILFQSYAKNVIFPVLIRQKIHGLNDTGILKVSIAQEGA